MYQVKLSKREEQELHQRIKLERDGRILKRYQSIMMNHQGITNTKIAKSIGVQKNTVTTWVKIYLEEGLEELSILKFTGKKSSKLDEIKDKIKAHVESELVSSMLELSNWIKTQFGYEVETSWLGRWCKKNSIFLLKSRE